MRRSRYPYFLVVISLLALWSGAEGCSSNGGGSGGSSSGSGGNGGGTGCPADKGQYAPPMGTCSNDGYQCMYGDTSCISVYVCKDGGWENTGCSMGNSSSSSSSSSGGSGGAGGN